MEDFDFAGMARGPAAVQCPASGELIVAGGAVDGMHDFDAGCAPCPPLAAADTACTWTPTKSAGCAFTSGTTGDPKCALHSFNTTIYAV